MKRFAVVAAGWLALAAPAGAAELSAGVSPESVPSSGATSLEYVLTITTGDTPEHLRVDWWRPGGNVLYARWPVTLRAPRFEGAGTMGTVGGFVADPGYA